MNTLRQFSLMAAAAVGIATGASALEQVTPSGVSAVKNGWRVAQSKNIDTDAVKDRMRDTDNSEALKDRMRDSDNSDALKNRMKAPDTDAVKDRMKPSGTDARASDADALKDRMK